jgi:hypothetical protein
MQKGAENKGKKSMYEVNSGRGGIYIFQRGEEGNMVFGQICAVVAID